MYLDINDKLKSKHSTIRMKCDECQAEYNAKLRTVFKQEDIVGHHQCKSCSSRRAGKKTAAKMSKIYSERYSGDGNWAKRKDVREKISKALKGKRLSEKHKEALRKPKSKTEKIIEAANRPHERKRRRDLALKRMNDKKLCTRHCFGKFDSGYVSTIQTLNPIWCRSGLEKSFLRSIVNLLEIDYVESAENIRISYKQDGENHIYLPDFKIVFKNGRTLIVELKGSYFLKVKQKNWELKEKSLKRFCKKNGYESFLFTEKDANKWLEELKK